MTLLTTPLCEFDTPAIDFNLQGIDNRTWSLQQCMGRNGLLIMFICNHCPYVKSIQTRLARDTYELKQLGIESVAIMSNDPTEYPEDSLDNMRLLAKNLNFSFPYLYDETQQIARNYNAVCTPDFFGYNKAFKLQYRGRFDASNQKTAPIDSKRDLFEAMKLIAETGHGPQQQTPSMGCSIKWKSVNIQN